MREDFLHFIWRYQKFNWVDLCTSSGESLSVVYPGDPNPHGGPDFLNARIWVGETLWVGNVEIHLNASDWQVHRHDADAAYDNVILHVVFEEDKLIYRRNVERLLCLELQRRILPGVRMAYYRLLKDKTHGIPCQPQFLDVEASLRTLWVERVAIERLEHRVVRFRHLLERNGQNWEETFFQVLARNLGQPANADPFEELARLTPMALLRRKRDDLFQLEALLFGQSGLLDGDQEEAYPQELRKEYAFLRRQYRLQPMEGSVWKFLRMRPANFPTLRIAQLARFVHQTEYPFDKAMSAGSLEEYEHLFELSVSQYWRTHYLFGQPESLPKDKALGRTTIRQLLVNAIAPLLFLYGEFRQNKRYLDQAVSLLTSLPPEDNQIVREWGYVGFLPDSALQSQGLIQLKKEYCDARRCLHCAIGHALLQGSDPGTDQIGGSS